MLITAVLLLAGGIWLYTRCTRVPGGKAVVMVDGETVAVLPLNVDAELALQPGKGFAGDSDSANTVAVEDGRVCVSYADCPDRVCVRTGWVRYDGEMIVCLPHRLIVTVIGGAAGPDAIAG